MNHAIDASLLNAIASLTPEQQDQVALFVRGLPTVTPGSLDAETRRKNVESLIGCLSDEDAAEMIAAIEEGCEQINHAAW